MSSNSSKNLLVKYVRNHYSADYIADAFYKANIAVVSKITVVEDIITKGFNLAYVQIDMWICSDIGCKILSELLSLSSGFVFNHNGIESDKWSVILNNHNDGSFYIQGLTRTFNNPLTFNRDIQLIPLTPQIYENKQEYDQKVEYLDLEEQVSLHKNLWPHLREVEYANINNYKSLM